MNVYRYTRISMHLLLLCIASVNGWSQASTFSLVYDRLSLNPNSKEPQKAIRSDRQDRSLILASVKPGMLLRSTDQGSTFSLACSQSDFGRVEASATIFSWENGRSAVIGNTFEQSSGMTSLTAQDRDSTYRVSFNWGSNGTVPPVHTYEPGVGVAGTVYTVDYGATWKGIGKSFINSNGPKVYSPVYGLIGPGEPGLADGIWYRVDINNNSFHELPVIPAKYTCIRSASDGTLIGFTGSSIGWLRPGDSTFKEQTLFKVPGKTQAVSLQMLEEVTWRGNSFYRLAVDSTTWYLVRTDSDSVHVDILVRSRPKTKFRLNPYDEDGFLICEKEQNGRPIGYTRYSKYGQIHSHPQLHKVPFFNETNITWSDSATYVAHSIAGSELSHLYRSSGVDSRLEHIGQRLSGEASDNHRSMEWCLLDTLDGHLIGRDALGSVLEFTNDSDIRGFLMSTYDTAPQRSVVKTFELTPPNMMVHDSLYLVGIDNVFIGQRNSDNTSASIPDNPSNPPIMLQRGKGNTFFFGRRDILQATYDGTVIDTISVSLPGEKQDSIGVLSGIVELDSMNLVVALKGYKSQNYDGDSLGFVPGGIIRTTDRGVTWQRASVPTNDQAYYSLQQLKSGAMLAVSVDAAILRDSASGYSTVRCLSGNILRSTDEGVTWTSQKSFEFNRQSLTQCTWRIWQGNKRIYVATPEAVMISTDDGVTWTAVNDFPLNCIINGVAEYKGQLYVATTMGIYRENAQTSVTELGTQSQPTINASATHSGQAWRITVTGLPTSRILGIDVYDIQGRQHPTEQLWSQDNTASITSPLPSHGVYGVVVHGPNGQRWTTAVGAYE